MRIFIVLIITIFSFSLKAQSGEIVEPVILLEGQGLKANFAQNRYLVGFDGKINSSGILYLFEDQRLIWDVTEPFASRMILEKNHVTQIVDGVETLNIPIQNFPALRNMQKVVAASLEGDWTILSNMFGKKPILESGGWSLNLQKDELPSNFPFTSIDIQGGEFVEIITMLRASGDQEEIIMFDHEIYSEEILKKMIGQNNE
ncbi:hypothetical protein [Curvivirga sp.]|uniref:hypothetical protein n=1 Tax=Curvivirga sp. TaxID=2856848 RepID=UPI003B58FAE7